MFLEGLANQANKRQLITTLPFFLYKYAIKTVYITKLIQITLETGSMVICNVSKDFDAQNYEASQSSVSKAPITIAANESDANS